jgi:hypothetical protein
MPDSVVPLRCRPQGMLPHRIQRWSIQFGVALCLVLQAGCHKPIKPGVTYKVSVVTIGPGGKATPQGEVTHVESATIETETGYSHEGQAFAVVVRKTQYGKATFDITFPDKSTQRVQAKVGEPKDILPNQQKYGVRIEVLESH